MINNKGNIKIIINQLADHWFYVIGVNVIPFDTQKRIPIIYQYNNYQNDSIPIELYEQWKREGKFEKGIAIILGKVCRGSNKDQYLIGIDIDREKGLREFLTKNNRQTDLKKFAEKTIVEQHKDELHRAHIYFYSPIALPQKSPDSVLGIEIKSRGEHGIMFVSPSIHKNGFNYEIIGEAKKPLLLSSFQAIEFDNEGFLWSSLSYSNEVLRVDPSMIIPGIELNGMLRIKLPQPDIFSPFGLSVVSPNNKTNTLFVSDHGSSRIIAIPTYNENILNEHIQNYTSYWTSPSKSFPNTLPSEIISDKEGNNIYFAEHGGNRIAKFSTDTKTMTEYEIPTGPLATTVFLSLSNDNTKVWFTEWASNKIGYVNITKQIPFKMSLANEGLNVKPIIFNNNTSYQTNVSLIRNNFTSYNQDNLSLNNIALSLSGMTDSGPKGITYSFDPPRINLTESNRENSLLQLDIVNDDIIRSENNTLMIVANTFNKDNLTTSILQPLPISIIKPESSFDASSTLEETTANYKNYNQQKTSISKSEINSIDIVKYVSLAIATILIIFIMYKKIKNRKITQKK